MTDQANNDDVPQQLNLQGAMTDERSHFYTLDAGCVTSTDRSLPQTGARPKTTNRPRSLSPAQQEPSSDAPFITPGSPKYEKPQKTRTNNSSTARVEPTGSENNLLVPLRALGKDEAEVALGTRGLVEGCDLAWDLAIPTVIRTVRPPLVGQSDENFQVGGKVATDDSQQQQPERLGDLLVEEESTQEDHCSNEAVGLLVLDVARVKEKFLRESNYQLVLVNKDLLQMSSPEPSCGESDLAVGNGAEGHVECRLSSPSVVSGSSRLEWDSGADVGYGGPRVIYGLSTLEKMAIGSYASVLRMEPEGTSSLCRDKAFQGFQKGPESGDNDTSDAVSDDTDDEVERTRRSLGLISPSAALCDDFKLSFHRSLPAIPKHDRLKSAPKSVSLTDLNFAVSDKQGCKLPRKGPEKVFPSSSDSTITVTSPFCSTAFGASLVEKPFYETPGSLQDNAGLGTSPAIQVGDGTLEKDVAAAASSSSYSRPPAVTTLEDEKFCLDGYPVERMKEHVSDFVGNIFRSAPAEQKMRIAQDLLKIIARNHREVVDAQSQPPQEDITDPHVVPSNSSQDAGDILSNSNSMKTSTSANSKRTNPLLDDIEVSNNFPRNLKRNGFQFNRSRNGSASKPRERRPDALWGEQRAPRYLPSESEESLRSRLTFRNRFSSPSEMTSEEISLSQSRSRSQTSSKDTGTSGSSLAAAMHRCNVKPGYNLRGQDVDILKGLIEKQRHMHIRRLEQEVQWLEKIENILTVNTGGFAGLRRLVGDLRDDRVRVRNGDTRREDRRRREKKMSMQSSNPVSETVRNFGQTFPSPVPIEPVASVAVQTSMVSSVKSENTDLRPVVSIPVSKTKLSQDSRPSSHSQRSNRNLCGGLSWFLPFGSKVTRSITLQEAFAKHKKEVMLNVEARQSAIADNLRVRNEKPKLSQDEAVRVLSSRRKMRVYTKPLQISENHHHPKQRHFTHRQIRENTEKLYRDLAEVVNEVEVKRREETNRCNRLMANIFGKRLLENVLNGKVSYGLQSQVPFIYHK